MIGSGRNAELVIPGALHDVEVGVTSADQEQDGTRRATRAIGAAMSRNSSRSARSLRTPGMDENPKGQGQPRPKHLLAPEEVARAAADRQDTDLTRAHGQGNGMRVHLITFGLASVAVLALVIGAIVLASRMM